MGPMIRTDFDLLARRPLVYHVTAPENLASLRRHRILKSAASLLVEGGRSDLLRARRRGPMRLPIGDDPVVVRGHDPLAPGALELTDGSTLADYIAYLNSLVYLWPGSERGPQGGASKLAKARKAAPVLVLRCSVRAPRAYNPGLQFLYADYNAGAARDHPTLGKAKRWVSFHRPASEFDAEPGDIKELAVVGSVALPRETECAPSTSGPWAPL